MLKCPECGEYALHTQGLYWHLRTVHSLRHDGAFEAAGTAEQVGNISVKIGNGKSLVWWDGNDVAGQKVARAVGKVSWRDRSKVKRNDKDRAKNWENRATDAAAGVLKAEGVEYHVKAGGNGLTGTGARPKVTYGGKGTATGGTDNEFRGRL